MRVSIWDLDWYYKFSFIPNYKAQKISSYYKQKGALINFIEKEEHINYEYDIIFILRDKKITPMPPPKYIDKKNVYLIGEEFKYYDNKFELTMEMNMVRPDYLIYEVPERNAYANAHVLKLMHGKQLLPARQDHKNYHVKYSQKTLVVDEFLWDLEEKELIIVLEELIGYKNIAFLNPINLKGVFLSSKTFELFSKLNFMSGTIIEFRNNYSSSYESSKEIINLAATMIEKNNRIKLKPIPIKAVTYNHWQNKEKGIEDLERILKIINYAKNKEVEVVVKTPKRRLTTPFWYFFDSIEAWTTNFYYTSYIESMVASRTARTKEEWYQPINDSSKWSTPRIQFLIHLLIRHSGLILKYGTQRKKDEYIDISLIKIEEIVKFVNKDKQNKELETLEKEFIKEVQYETIIF